MTLADDLWTAGYGALTTGTGFHVYGKRARFPAIWVAAMIVSADWLSSLALWHVKPHWLVSAPVHFALCAIFLAVALKRRIWWALALGLLYAGQVAVDAAFQAGDLSTHAANWIYDAALNVLFLGQLAVLWAACRKSATVGAL